jgi:hypothetical protein
VNVIQELNENITGIDFIHSHTHTHKFTYDVISCQVKFARVGMNSIASLTNTVLPGYDLHNCQSKIQRSMQCQGYLHGQHLCSSNTYGLGHALHRQHG